MVVLQRICKKITFRFKLTYIFQPLYMNNNEIFTLYNKIKFLKKNQGFLSKYGLDLIISIIIIYIFLVFTFYFYAMNHLPYLKKNWEVNKCNPIYIPFAGFVVKDKNKSNIEIVGENFTYCTQNILTSIVGDAFAPIYYIVNLVSEAIQDITGAINTVRGMFSKIRTNITDTTTNISGRTLNTMLPVSTITTNIKDMIGKTYGSLLSSFYTLFSVFLISESFFNLLVDAIEGLLIILGAMIISLWAISWFFWPAIPEAIAATIGYGLILIPFLTVIFIVHSVYDLAVDNTPKSAPSRPSCFDKDTKLCLENNKLISISEIEIGSKLKGNKNVIGKMKLWLGNNKIYNYKDVLVTGDHRVNDRKWGLIKICDHPEAKEIKNYGEKFVYCINTDTKDIEINEHVFLDWDDIDSEDLEDININCKNLPYKIEINEINKYLDNGICGNTELQLLNGKIKKLKNINIGDILYNGEKVLGFIEIDTKIKNINEYNINNEVIICTENIEILFNQNNFINTSNINNKKINYCKNLYNLITDKGYFYINNLKVLDYNSGIEKYLKKSEFDYKSLINIQKFFYLKNMYNEYKY